MNNNLIFWLYAYALMFLVLLFAFSGIKKVRQADYQGHLTAMVRACNLLLFFVLSYVVKVFVLGREDKSEWTTLHLVALYIHETFILLMLICGGRARYLASKFQHGLFAGTAGEADPALRRQHARWGTWAIAAALAAFITATAVIYFLYRQNP